MALLCPALFAFGNMALDVINNKSYQNTKRRCKAHLNEQLEATCVKSIQNLPNDQFSFFKLQDLLKEQNLTSEMLDKAVSKHSRV